MLELYKKTEKKVFFSPILICLLFTFLFSYHSILRHLTFNSHAYDLGIYTQVVYLYSQGLTPYSSIMHIIQLADHFGPILFFFAPIYKLFPSPNSLLIIQALFVSLSSLPVFIISYHKFKHLLLSIVLTISYLASAGIARAIDFDFHLATLSTLPLSLIILTWYFKKWRLYFICLFLSLLFKEDLPIFITGFGVYLLIKKQTKIAIFTILFGIISFVLIKFQIIPYLYRREDPYINTLLLPYNSPIDLFLLIISKPGILLDQIFNSPEKTETIKGLYGEYLFLPFLSPLSWLTVFPNLFLRFSSNLRLLWLNGFHHNANLEIFLAISSIFAIDYFKFNKKAITIALIVVLLLNGLSPGSIPWEPLDKSFSSTKNYDYINQNLKVIPPNTPVSAQSAIVPHLANRERIYMFPEVADAQYIVFDTSLNPYPLDLIVLNDRIERFKKSPYWKLIAHENSMLIFVKK